MNYVPLGIQSHFFLTFGARWLEMGHFSNECAAPTNHTRALHSQSVEMTDTLTVTDVKERAVVHGREKVLEHC